jgi:hypothetical protein
MHMSDEKLQAFQGVICQLPESVHPVWCCICSSMWCKDLGKETLKDSVTCLQCLHVLNRECVFLIHAQRIITACVPVCMSTYNTGLAWAAWHNT